MLVNDLYKDNYLKFEHSEVINSTAVDLESVGATTSTSLRTLSITPSNSNSIFVSKNGNNTTGDGTQELPYLTIQRAIDKCTEAKTYVVIDDDGHYYEQLTIYGNCVGVYANLGKMPILSLPATENITRWDKLLLANAEAQTTFDLGNPLSSPFNDASSYFNALHQNPTKLSNGNYAIAYKRYRTADYNNYMKHWGEVRLRIYNDTFTNIINDYLLKSTYVQNPTAIYNGTSNLDTCFAFVLKDCFVFSYKGIHYTGVSTRQYWAGLLVSDFNGNIIYDQTMSYTAPYTNYVFPDYAQVVKDNIWIGTHGNYIGGRGVYFYEGGTLKLSLGTFSSYTQTFRYLTTIDNYAYVADNTTVYKINLTTWTYTSNTLTNLQTLNSNIGGYQYIFKDVDTGHFYVICKKSTNNLYMFEMDDPVNPTVLYKVITDSVNYYLNLADAYNLNAQDVSYDTTRREFIELSENERLHRCFVSGDSQTASMLHFDKSKIKSDFGTTVFNLTYFQKSDVISNDDFIYMISDWKLRRKTFDGTNISTHGTLLVNKDVNNFIYVGNNKILVNSDYSDGMKLYLKDLSDTDTESYGTLFFNNPNANYFINSMCYIPETNEVVYSYRFDGTNYKIYKKSITDTTTTSPGTAITTSYYDDVMYVGNSKILMRSRSDYNKHYIKSVSDVENVTLFINISNAIKLAYSSELNGIFVSYNGESNILRIKYLTDSNTTNMGTIVSNMRLSSSGSTRISNGYLYYLFDASYHKHKIEDIIKNERFASVIPFSYAGTGYDAIATYFKPIKDYKMPINVWSGNITTYYNIKLCTIFDFDLIKTTVPTEINGLIIDLLDDTKRRNVITSSANITLKYNTIKNVFNDIDLLKFPSYVLQSTGGASIVIENNEIHDVSSGILITSNAVSMKQNALYRFVDSGAVKITGSGSGIIIDHNTLFNNYSGIELSGNGGTEIIKNSIFNDNGAFGVKVATTLAIKNSIYTDTVIGATLDDSTKNLNPLFINEGIENPNLTNLHFQSRAAGYEVNSPALELADDNYDAGCYKIQYVLSPPTYTSFVISKPKKIVIDYNAVNPVEITAQDGTYYSSVDAWQEEVTLEYSSVLAEDLENLLKMYLSGSEIRIYFNPDTDPFLFETFNMKFKAISLSNEVFRLNKNGVKDFKMIFIRKFLLEELNG